MQHSERLDQIALDGLFRYASLGLALVDVDKRYVRVNDAFAAMNGIPADDHIGRTPREVIPEVAAAVESVLDHVLQTKLPMVGLEVDTPGAGEISDRRSVRVSLYPLVDDGVAVGVLGIAEATAG